MTMFKKKEYTAYTIVCVVNGEFGGLVGLFRNKAQAEDCCKFWNEHATPDAEYKICYILTDF